jgi:hypothetical protein
MSARPFRFALLTSAFFLVLAAAAAASPVAVQSITDSPDPVSWGHDITYVVTIVNSSAQAQSNADGNGGLSGSDIPGVKIKSLSVSKGHADLIPEAHEGGFRWSADGPLQPGEKVVVTVVVTTPTPGLDGGYLALSATAGVADDLSDYVIERTTFRKRSGAAAGEKILGTSAAETLTGTSRNDQLFGFGGNDVLKGLAGDDLLNGGPGKDTFYGGSGNDTIKAYDHVAEKVSCGKGKDKVQADRKDKLSGCEKVHRI